MGGYRATAWAQAHEAQADESRSRKESTPAEKLDHIAVVSRNKVDQDSSTGTQTVYQADGTTVYAEATVNTTGDSTTRGELADPA